jgi:hypothetical protein
VRKGWKSWGWIEFLSSLSNNLLSNPTSTFSICFVLALRFCVFNFGTFDFEELPD